MMLPGEFDYDQPWPVPVELTGYVVSRAWRDETGRVVPHVDLRTTCSPWPLVASVGEVAAALHLSGSGLSRDTDLDTLAYLVVQTVARLGWFTVGTLEIGSDDVAARLDDGTADLDDYLLHVEMWGSRERERLCRAAAVALCVHGPQVVRDLPGHGVSPAWGDVTS